MALATKDLNTQDLFDNIEEVVMAETTGATASEVQSIVNGINVLQDIGLVHREIGESTKETWQAEAAVQRDLASTKDSLAQSATSNAVANLVGQGDIKLAVAESRYDVANAIRDSAADVVANANNNASNNLASMNLLAGSLAAGHSAIQAAISDSKYATAAAIAESKYATTIAMMNEADKTRAVIAAFAATQPTFRELDLERKLAVAELDNRHIAQMNAINSMNSELRLNTQSTIAIGSNLTGNAQTATAVRQ